MTGIRERIAREAHALEESGSAIADEVESIAKAAPGVIKAAPGYLADKAHAAMQQVKHAAEETPGAVQRAGRWAVDQVMAPAPAHHAHHAVPQHAAAHAPAHAAGAQATGHRGPAPLHGQTIPGAGPMTALHGVPFLRRMNETDTVSPMDVRQGGFNDCWLMASLAAIARADPASIKQLIVDKGGGFYEVTLYTGKPGKDGLPTAEKFVVDSTFPANEKGHVRGAQTDLVGAQGAELWPLLIEKAMAVKKHGVDGLVLTDSGLTARLFSGMDLVQNKGHVQRHFLSSLGEDEILKIVSDGLAHHRPMTSLALWTPYLAKFGVHSYHHYAVARVDTSKRTIDLQNPWGSEHVIGMKIADYVICFESLEVGPDLRAKSA